MDPGPKNIGLRLSGADLARLDAWIARSEGKVPGLQLTRTEAVRSLLRRALDADEGGEG